MIGYSYISIRNHYFAITGRIICKLERIITKWYPCRDVDDTWRKPSCDVAASQASWWAPEMAPPSNCRPPKVRAG